MSVDENELNLLTNLLNEIDDIDEANKTEIINRYIIADIETRTMVLIMIKDYIEHKSENKNEILHL